MAAAVASSTLNMAQAWAAELQRASDSYLGQRQAPAGKPETLMWTAPSSQGVCGGFDPIACVHMSGLLMRSHMNAGQDGFRDKGSKQSGDL
jgi:hypothetical protein